MAGLYPKQLAQYFALAGIPQSKGSKVFIVDAVNGSDSNTGRTFQDPLKTVAAALALTTTLKNDLVLLVGNGTSYSEAAIDWHHDFTHLIGLNSGGPEPRSRIKCTAALASTPFFTVSGDGCIIKNISFWHETTDAAGLVNVLVSGSRNTFEGCQFAGAVGTNNASGARSLKVGAAGEGSGNVFRNCVFGCDTVQLASGVTQVEFVSGAMHTVFEDCVFAHSAGNTNNAFVTAAAAAGVGRLNIFKRCIFINEVPSVVQAEVINLGEALSESSRIFLIDCWKYGVTDWDHNNRGVINNGEYATSVTGTNAANTLLITSA